MAKKRKGADAPNLPRQVPDLFAILTCPGRGQADEHNENDADSNSEGRTAIDPIAWDPENKEKPFASFVPIENAVECGEPEDSMKKKIAPAKQMSPVTDATSPGDSSVELCGDPADSFEKIYADGLKCTACSLYKTRTHLVLGEGNPRATLVFIGEAPGADEDECGRPFVGRAGQHLDKILTAAGFRRDELYICNIVKDRPPENRTPTKEEMTACTPLLHRQLALLRPKLIGLLGNVSIKHVVGPDTPGVTQIHGQWFDSIFGIPCMPLYHPSYLLRYGSREKGSPNWQMWQDIQELKKKYDQVLAGDFS